MPATTVIEQAIRDFEFNYDKLIDDGFDDDETYQEDYGSNLAGYIAAKLVDADLIDPEELDDDDEDYEDEWVDDDIDQYGLDW